MEPTAPAAAAEAPASEAPAAPAAPAVSDAVEAPVAPVITTTTAPADAVTSGDLVALAQSTGGDSTLTIVLAILTVVGGAAGWKFYSQYSEQKHEQAMEKLKLDREAAGLGGAQPPPCAVKQAEVDAKIADLSARIDAVLKKTATLDADFDGADVERRVKKLERAVKALGEGN